MAKRIYSGNSPSISPTRPNLQTMRILSSDGTSGTEPSPERLVDSESEPEVLSPKQTRAIVDAVLSARIRPERIKQLQFKKRDVIQQIEKLHTSKTEQVLKAFKSLTQVQKFEKVRRKRK